MSCSCLIGRTFTPERRQALDAELRGATASLGALAREYGVTKPTLGRHKLKCLALAPEHGGRFQERAAGPETAPETARDDRPIERDWPPRARAEPSEDHEVTPTVRQRETSHETAAAPLEEAPTIDASALALADVAALGVVGFAPQVRFVADMIARGAWKDRRSVRALCAAWGLGRDAVHERHRAAAVLVGEDRGASAEQLENTIGLVTAGAEECEEAALKLEHPTDPEGKPRPASEDELALALKYRALGAKNRGVRMRLEGLIQTRVSVSLEADPRITGLLRTVWDALGEVDAAIREREEVERGRLAAFVAAVETLTGGALPVEAVQLVARGEAMPAAVDTVRAAVRAYEERIGGRQGGTLVIGKAGA